MDLEARHKKLVYALKVLEVRGNKVIVRHPLKKDACVLLPVPAAEYCEPGLYVDVQFIPDDKFAAKYKAVYQGITSPEFVPKNGAGIN